MIQLLKPIGSSLSIIQQKHLQESLENRLLLDKLLDRPDNSVMNSFMEIIEDQCDF